MEKNFKATTLRSRRNSDILYNPLISVCFTYMLKLSHMQNCYIVDMWSKYPLGPACSVIDLWNWPKSQLQLWSSWGSLLYSVLFKCFFFLTLSLSNNEKILKMYFLPNALTFLTSNVLSFLYCFLDSLYSCLMPQTALRSLLHSFLLESPTASRAHSTWCLPQLSFQLWYKETSSPQHLNWSEAYCKSNAGHRGTNKCPKVTFGLF